MTGPLPGQQLPGTGCPARDEHPELLPGHLASAVRGCASRAAFAGRQPAAWYGYLRELGLPAIATACARRAARTADDVPDPWPRADAQADAAIALATAARTGEALDCAGRIGVASAQVRALAGITVAVAPAATRAAPAGTWAAGGVAASGGTAGAEAARAEAAGGGTASGGTAAAQAIARQALDVAGVAGFPGGRADALAMAAEALAAAGLTVQAADVAASIGDPWARAEAYSHVAAFLPADAWSAGDGAGRAAPAACEEAVLADAVLAEALAAADSVVNRSWRAEAKAAVAELLCRHGRLPRAHDVAVSIDDPVWRADAVLALAAYSPDYAEAHQLFREAARLGGRAGYQWWQSGRLARALATLLWSAPGDLCPLAVVSQLRSHPAVLVATARELATRPRGGGDRAWCRVLGALARAGHDSAGGVGAGGYSAGLAAACLDDVQATALLAACATAMPGCAPALRRLATGPAAARPAPWEQASLR